MSKPARKKYYICMSDLGLEHDFEPEGTHAGHVDDDEQRAVCPCKWKGPIRDFRFQAKEDLLGHYEKMGTLVCYLDVKINRERLVA